MKFGSLVEVETYTGKKNHSKMSNETSELFALAAKFFLKRYKASGKSQSSLARELEVSSPYLSSIVNGSRSASFDLYTQIANKLYGPFDKFLAVGRRIKEGREPLSDYELDDRADNDVEHLIARLTYYVMDHRRIEGEIKELKHFYESIVENLQSAVLVTNKKNEVIYASKRIDNICGITVDEVIGRNPLTIEKSIPGLQLYPFVQKYIEAYDQLKPVYFGNIHVVTPRGASRYNSGWIIPLLKEGVYNGMICTLRDTSSSHALFSLLAESIEQINDAVCICQQEGPGEMPVVFFANKKYRDIFGIEEVDPFSLSFRELFEIMAESVVDEKGYRQFVQKTITENIVNPRFLFEHVDGKQYAILGNPISDKHGMHIGRMVTLEEII